MPQDTPGQRRTPVHSRWGYPLLLRLHFYAGLLVGPFIFVAALSGALFAMTPQIEQRVYQTELTTDSHGASKPLADQIRAAQRTLGDDVILAAVRPAAADGHTTRVMFSVPGLEPGEHRAIFVDPVSLAVRGDLVVYGTSGTLPFRIWIDYLHRHLHLGEFGRYYSELAASWLWLVGLGGLALWWRRRHQLRIGANNGHRQTLRRWHGTLGVMLLVMVMFFSATGLTWSKWAGANISDLRTQLDWGTPSLNTRLDEWKNTSQPHHHHGISGPGPENERTNPGLYDAMLATARQAGIDAGAIEIRPGTDASRAWTVREIDRSWPTQVDVVAIDPKSMVITDQLVFEDFPLAAKLTRWGIDAHMGILFGLANQLLVAGAALGLCVLIVLGYRMWWLKRPTRGDYRGGTYRGADYREMDPHRVWAHLRKAPPLAWLLMAVVTVAVGLFAPVMGVSLLVFLLVDGLLAFKAYRRMALCGLSPNE